MTHNSRLATDDRYRAAYKGALAVRRSRKQAIRCAERIAAMLASWKAEQLGRKGAVVLPLYRMRGGW